MKKIFSIFLTLAMLLGLVSCGEIEGGIEGVYRSGNGMKGYCQFYKDGRYYEDAEIFLDDPDVHEMLDVRMGNYAIEDNKITLKERNGNEKYLYTIGDYICAAPFEGNLKVEDSSLIGKVEFQAKTSEYFIIHNYEFFEGGRVKNNKTTDNSDGERLTEEYAIGMYLYIPETGIIYLKMREMRWNLEHRTYSMLSDGIFYANVYEKVKE